MKILKTVLKFVFAIGAIYWLVDSGKLDFASLVQLANPIYLIPCFLFVGLGLASGCLRWKLILDSQGVHLSFFNAFRFVLIGTFFNFLMPGGVGGDVMKAYYVSQNFPQAKIKAAISVLMDRMIGLFAMLVMALPLILWRWDLLLTSRPLQMIFLILLGLFSGFCVFWAVIFSRRVHELKWIKWLFGLLPEGGTLHKIYTSVQDYQHSKNVFLPVLAISLANQFIATLFFFVADQGLGQTGVPISAYLFVVPVGFMIQAIPISPAGVGLGQAGFLFLFHLLLGPETTNGPASMTAFQIFNLLYGLIGAYFYLTAGKQKNMPSINKIKHSVGIDK
jgi:glycosyltransferase 2 family protein